MFMGLMYDEGVTALDPPTMKIKVVAPPEESTRYRLEGLRIEFAQ